MEAAQRHGTVVSYDLNYRPSLWKSIGGPERAAEVNRRLVEHVDVLLGNEEDFSAALGFEIEGRREPARPRPRRVRPAARTGDGGVPTARGGRDDAPAGAKRDRQRLVGCLPDRRAASMLRRRFEALEIFDRVGGGDSFASGSLLRPARRPGRHRARVRRRARRPRDDDARRHVDGDARRGRAARRRRLRPRAAVVVDAVEGGRGSAPLPRGCASPLRFVVWSFRGR